MTSSFRIFAVLFAAATAASAATTAKRPTAKAADCDESLKGEVVAVFENCFASYKRELESLAAEGEEFKLEDESCRLVDRYMQCSNILSICSMDDESEKAVDDMMRTNLLSMFVAGRAGGVENCLAMISPSGRRPKRSPDRRTSTVKKIAKTLIKNRKTITRRLKGSGGRGGGVSSSNSGKSKLRKYGKYAVAGVAAYGAYKLAKAMVKGHRKLYDDDDCWEYQFLSDRYECVCPSRCDVYAGGAAAASPAALGFGSALCFSAAVAFLSRRTLS